MIAGCRAVSFEWLCPALSNLRMPNPAKGANLGIWRVSVEERIIRMKRVMALAGAVVVAAVFTACAPQPPSSDMTMSGTHTMPGPGRPGTMSNEVMPGLSPNCSPEALATMPPEHRAACGLQ